MMLRMFTSWTLSAATVALFVVALKAPDAVLVHVVLHTPTCLLAGTCTGNTIAHPTLILWTAFSLVCSWAADGMLWHNRCDNVLVRNDEERAVIRDTAMSHELCMDYIVVLRTLSALFSIVQVFYVMYMMVQIMNRLLVRTLASVRRKRGGAAVAGVLHAQVQQAERVGEDILRHLGFAEFVLFIISVQMLRTSLNFVVMPATALILPLAYVQGVHLVSTKKQRPTLHYATGVVSVALAFATAFQLETCDEFFTVFTGDFEAKCEGERTGTLFLLTCLVAAYLNRMF